MADIIQLSDFRPAAEPAPRPRKRRAARKSPRRSAPRPAREAHLDPLQQSFAQLRRHLDRIEHARHAVDSERERVLALAREAEQVLRWIESGDVAACARYVAMKDAAHAAATKAWA